MSWKLLQFTHNFININGCINVWNTTCMCGIVAHCNFYPSTQLFWQQLFGWLLSLYNATPLLLSLTLSKWLLLSMYSWLPPYKTCSTLDSFNAGLVQCKNSLKLHLFDAGLVWHFFLSIWCQTYLNEWNLTMWLVCHFLLLCNATHLLLSLTPQCNLFVTFSHSTRQLICQFL